MTKRMVDAYDRHGTEAWDAAFSDRRDRDAALELMTEAIETRAIFYGLRRRPDAIPQYVLQRWVSGPLDLADETSSGAHPQGRNTAFELSMFALMDACGLAPQYEEPDIVVRANGAACLMACKRPQKKRTVKNNFNEARDQIARHLPTYALETRAPFGLVMISLSKIYDDAPIEMATAADFDAGWRYIDQFRERYQHLWQNPGVPLGGVLYHLLRPALDRETMMLVQRQYVGGVSLHHAGPEAAVATDAISRRLRTHSLSHR